MNPISEDEELEIQYRYASGSGSVPKIVINELSRRY